MRNLTWLPWLPEHLVIHKKTKPRSLWLRGFEGKSLTMTYFHRRTSTIIGAKVFHGPVRDGKEWDHLAMVVKRSLLNCWGAWRDRWGTRHGFSAIPIWEEAQHRIWYKWTLGARTFKLRWDCYLCSDPFGGVDNTTDQLRLHLFERHLNAITNRITCRVIGSSRTGN